MTGKNHLICNTAGIAAAGVGCYILSKTPDIKPETVETVKNFLLFQNKIDMRIYLPLCFLMFVIGTYLPDCDQKNSKIGKFLHLPFEHRTWTHTVWFALIFAIGGIWFPPLFLTALGILGHIFMDSLSKQGICWFFPKYEKDNGSSFKKHHFLKLYSTGKMSEVIVTIFTVLICAGAIFLGLKFLI
ncbi:MAG: metal-dependent hydrolase [Lachnospiraceae bacterium]|nr:metal-dependent hydrolase [Lachnospiraceae bacterium]